MNNDYPTDEQLEKIKNWDNYKDMLGLIDYIESIYPHYGFIQRRGKYVQRVVFVTGGWSGCEDIISAMDRNVGLMLAWEASYKGGKHIYKVRNYK